MIVPDRSDEQITPRDVIEMITTGVILGTFALAIAYIIFWGLR